MTTLIMVCAKYLIWGIVLLGLFVLASAERWQRMLVSTVVSLPVAYALGKIAGMLWYDPRPFVQSGVAPLIAHAADNGFPSDHMLMAATIASIAYAYNRLWGIALWVLALAVGVARVLAGVHHFVDLAASILIAMISVAVVEYAIRTLWPPQDSPAIQ